MPAACFAASGGSQTLRGRRYAGKGIFGTVEEVGIVCGKNQFKTILFRYEVTALNVEGGECA